MFSGTYHNGEKNGEKWRTRISCSTRAIVVPSFSKKTTCPHCCSKSLSQWLSFRILIL